jgi:Cu2+-exporting ATPase
MDVRTAEYAHEEHRAISENGSGGHARGERRGHNKQQHGHRAHHAHMAADFRRRFWISLILTLPILALSPMLQQISGLFTRNFGSAFGSTGLITQR